MEIFVDSDMSPSRLIFHLISNSMHFNVGVKLETRNFVKRWLVKKFAENLGERYTNL